MGLASALTTALTGLNAAEVQIDVVGNNLANSQTIGFKASDTVFVTQFLQTQSLGSAPSDFNGGTNPRQTGLGVRVAEISPNFGQGTIEVSSNPSDLAIQGEGFFIVEGSSGEVLYTRNGVFKTNTSNELVTVTGNRVLGYGVDTDYVIQRTELTPITIPIGNAAVAKATTEVTLEGVLTPSGDIANVAEVIQSGILGDASDIYPRPDATDSASVAAAIPDETAAVLTNADGVGGANHAEGSVYQYRFVYVDASGTESPASDPLSFTVPAGDSAANNRIQLQLPPGTSEYTTVRVYRTDAGGSVFYDIGSGAAGATFNDDTTGHSLGAATLDTSSLTGNYSYLVTFFDSESQTESRPSERIGPVTVVNGRIHLQDLPSIPPGTEYDKVRVYRNLNSDSDNYYLVGTVDTNLVGSDLVPENFTDNRSDVEISDLDVTGNKLIDLDGPRIGFQTRLTDIVRRDGLNFENVFEEGVLDFSSRKGGRQLAERQLTITTNTTVEELLDFMEDALGIQTSLNDPQNPFPNSLNVIAGESGELSPGATVTSDGQIRIVGNNGVDNAIELGLSSFRITKTDNTIASSNLGFGSIQDAVGQSAVADFIAYDSLGVAINVRVTAVLQEISGSATTYRWFADSPSNDPSGEPNVRIAVGTGLVSFDGEGNLIGTTNDLVTIDRRDVPSEDPLEFRLNFDNVTGLSESKASLQASRQDGSSSGTLTSFIVGEDGVIRGVFSNGVTRDLGEVRLARFANAVGLEQVGQTLFRQGVNAGLPILGGPGDNGLGKIVAGARELSNTDIGQNMIDLVLASTQYRSNSRVITTAQELLDELLNLRR
jgi:flagellar hook protein FlgE